MMADGFSLAFLIGLRISDICFELIFVLSPARDRFPFVPFGDEKSQYPGIQSSHVKQINFYPQNQQNVKVSSFTSATVSHMINFWVLRVCVSAVDKL